MEFASYLRFLRQKEKELFGENRLPNAMVISLARQSVAKNKVSDPAWLREKMFEMLTQIKPGNALKGSYSRPTAELEWHFSA